MPRPTTYLPRLPAAPVLPWKGSLVLLGVLLLALLALTHGQATYTANTQAFWSDWQRRQPQASVEQHQCAARLWGTPYRGMWQRWVRAVPHGERLAWQARAELGVSRFRRQDMNRFVLGFAFSPDEQHVLLLRKRAKDPFNPDRWNGLGGRIEPGETPEQAVSREVEEESGLAVPPEAWMLWGRLSDDATFQVDVFCAQVDLTAATTRTDESVRAFTRAEVHELVLAASVDDILAHWLA